ncbi:MAG: hypothetical protein KJP19_05620, partial [Deltaproteobacteria bacterium]|nr:hypothetical protein [Deltaproteobacteria bacterium]
TRDDEDSAACRLGLDTDPLKKRSQAALYYVHLSKFYINRAMRQNFFPPTTHYAVYRGLD